MKVVSLFSGIGGLDLGLKQAGHEIILQVETDARARQCLVTHFREACQQQNVESVWDLPSETELLVAGFPCQDVSFNSSNRAGLDGYRTSLVHAVFRLLKRRRVPCILFENVEGILSPVSNQLITYSKVPQKPVVEFLVENLESLGYSWAYRVIDTRAFGIPHRRRRVFLLAMLYGDPRDILLAQSSAGHHPFECACIRCSLEKRDSHEAGAYAVDLSCWNRSGDAEEMCTLTRQNGQRTMLILPRRSNPIGMLTIHDAERLQGFPVDWTIHCRGNGGRSSSAEGETNARFAFVGNAVSVPVAKWIGEALLRPLMHKYGKGPTDRQICVPCSSSVHPDGRLSGSKQSAQSHWPRAAWGSSQGRYEATSLLESPGVDCPVIRPFASLDRFVGSLGEMPNRAVVMQYVEGMKVRKWEIIVAVRLALMKAFHFEEHHFFTGRLSAAKSLVWARCPRPYKPPFWPGVQLAEEDWPEEAKRHRKRPRESFVVRFFDDSWLWTDECLPYRDSREDMEAQDSSSRWSKQFATACQRARQEFDWLERSEELAGVPSDARHTEQVSSV